MPTTINGVGAHYYGKKNLSQRTAPCSQCGQTAELSSYDTRLWGVFIFIPLIPLGRRRIIDQCPNCTYHGAIPMAEYEKLREGEIREAMEKMRANLNDEKAAIELHRTLISFHRHEEADQLLKQIETRFPQNAEALAHLGAVMHFKGLHEEAHGHYRRAHEIDPELPAARVDIACQRIDQGELDAARDLIRFLEEPGAPPGSGAQVALAGAYQANGRHREALDLLTIATRKSPELAGVPEVREMFALSEQALNITESALPPAPGRERLVARRIIMGLAFAVIVGSLLFANHHKSRHRSLYIVSGLPEPVTIQIGDLEPVQLRGAGARKTEIPEGKWTARVSGAVEEEIAFEIAGGIAERWSDDMVYVLNVDGSAVLMRERIAYTAEKSSATALESDYSYHLLYGVPFVKQGGIDFVFKDFPERLQLDTLATKEYRRGCLDWNPTTWAAAFMDSFPTSDRPTRWIWPDGASKRTASPGSSGSISPRRGPRSVRTRRRRCCAKACNAARSTWSGTGPTKAFPKIPGVRTP